MLKHALDPLTEDCLARSGAPRSTFLRLALAAALLAGLGVTVAKAQTNASSGLGQNLKLTLSEARAWYERGISHYQKQDWENAVSDFSEAVRLDPQDAMACFYRGVARIARGDMDTAISDFDQVVLLQPTNSEAIFYRGAARRSKGDPDNAILDFTECLRLNPKHAEAHKNRAICHASKGEFQKAIDDWSAGLELRPDDGPPGLALSNRGWDYFMTGQFDKAVKDYTEAIRVNSQSVNANCYLAWLRATCPRASLRNGKEALEAAQKACSLSGWTDWWCLHTLAAASAESDDFKKAVQYEKQAMDMRHMSEQDRESMQRRLSLYEHRQPYHEGQKP
jgi:tetratricopeptide (TPR) repeat protein